MKISKLNAFPPPASVEIRAGGSSTRKNMALLESMMDFDSTSLPPSQIRLGASAMAPGEAAGGFQVGGSVAQKPSVTDVKPLVMGGVAWCTRRVSVAESPAAGNRMADTATSSLLLAETHSPPSGKLGGGCPPSGGSVFDHVPVVTARLSAMADGVVESSGAATTKALPRTASLRIRRLFMLPRPVS